MHPITIGTCGWSYKEWAGPFYPKGTPPGEFLRLYAEHYPMVEVDSTYYGSPAPKTAQGWWDKTPDGFRFSLKVPSVITHEKCFKDCEVERDAFLAVARLLGDKLFCCVLQFGYFNRTAFDGLRAFLDRLEPFLAAWPADVQLCVEVRNKAWMTAKLADTLRQHRAIWVLPDQKWMPTPLELVEKLDPVTGPFAYVRVLGDRGAVDALTDKLDHIVIDRSAELRRTAEAIARLAGRVPVLAFVNNHYAGYAPETLKQLQTVIRELQEGACRTNGADVQ